MIINAESLTKLILYILLFPTFFQQAFIEFAWAAGEPVVLMSLRRLFLLLPVFAIILGCWVTVPALITVLFRQNRKEYVNALFLTWWDLGKSIVSFWGGIIQFMFNLTVALLELVKLILAGIWFSLHSLLLMPFKLLGNVSQKVVRSGIPWIAVFLTLFWVLIEATIFTYVTTPLVVDTLSNITGEQLSIAFVRIPLFAFLFFIVLGSYAVLSTFMDSVKNRNIAQIISIAVIEVIVLSVEVVFLYREFVDALIPWFALYATDVSITMTGILAFSAFMWFGIRSLSWFLFASYGTPTIMAVIQGKGLEHSKKPKTENKSETSESFDSKNISGDLMATLKKDADWVQEKGDVLLASFMLPPLQVIAASINFCTLLTSGSHLFELPFKELKDIKQSKGIMNTVPGQGRDTSKNAAVKALHDH